MSQRQFADRDGHRWDVEDEGPVGKQAGGGRAEAAEVAATGSRPEGAHLLRFTRDDGTERVRTAPLGVDQLGDAELRAVLEGQDPADAGKGPDTEANRSGGYGDAVD